MLFNITINDLDVGLREKLSKVTDNTNLREAVDSLKDREALQRDLGKLEDWEKKHQPYEVQQGKMLDSASVMGQPWMYVQTGE